MGHNLFDGNTFDRSMAVSFNRLRDWTSVFLLSLDCSLSDDCLFWSLGGLNSQTDLWLVGWWRVRRLRCLAWVHIWITCLGNVKNWKMMNIDPLNSSWVATCSYSVKEKRSVSRSFVNRSWDSRTTKTVQNAENLETLKNRIFLASALFFH